MRKGSGRSNGTVSWIPLPDRITEAEVNLKLQWSADERTRQAIAAVLAGNEEDTVVTDDCRLVCGHEAYDLSRLAGGRRSKIVCYPVEQKVF
jgi:hypothetical protein